MYQGEVKVHKHAKKELGQDPAILTSLLVNNRYVSPYAGALRACHATFIPPNQ